MKYFNFALASAAVCFFMLWFINWEENNRLRSIIEKTEQELLSIQKQQTESMASANNALREREEIHEKQKRKVCEIENTLRENSDFDSILVPDDIRLRWQEECRDNTVIAPGSTTR